MLVLVPVLALQVVEWDLQLLSNKFKHLHLNPSPLLIFSVLTHLPRPPPLLPLLPSTFSPLLLPLLLLLLRLPLLLILLLPQASFLSPPLSRLLLPRPLLLLPHHPCKSNLLQLPLPLFPFKRSHHNPQLLTRTIHGNRVKNLSVSTISENRAFLMPNPLPMLQTPLLLPSQDHNTTASRVFRLKQPLQQLPLHSLLPLNRLSTLDMELLSLLPTLLSVALESLNLNPNLLSLSAFLLQPPHPPSEPSMPTLLLPPPMPSTLEILLSAERFAFNPLFRRFFSFPFPPLTCFLLLPSFS